MEDSEKECNFLTVTSIYTLLQQWNRSSVLKASWYLSHACLVGSMLVACRLCWILQAEQGPSRLAQGLARMNEVEFERLCRLDLTRNYDDVIILAISYATRTRCLNSSCLVYWTQASSQGFFLWLEFAIFLTKPLHYLHPLNETRLHSRRCRDSIQPCAGL